MSTGIHHITAITADVQKNVDFYTGFLGLRLVKQTPGHEDPDQLHLFYGDRLGSPGSLVSFLVWESGARGRAGLGQVGEFAFAVPKDSIGEWLTRAMSARIQIEGPVKEFGETVLRLKDPDGIIIKLVASDMIAAAPLKDAIAPTRIRAATLFTDKPEETARYLGMVGYKYQQTSGNIRRFASQTDAIDLRDATGFYPGVAGAGTVDHLALRAADDEALSVLHKSLSASDEVTNAHDRIYFRSLYLREPSGVLLEYATDSPGMTADEDAASLGENLIIPHFYDNLAEDIRIKLPQFSRHDEERMPMRDLHFVHRFHRPAEPDGSALVLLHGTGGNEADLFPLAARIAPNATLLGVRGRSTEEGIFRWFRRYDAVTYDQDDIRNEAEAFAAFTQDAIRAYDLDEDRISYLGYSNGANLLGAVIQLYPYAVRRAVLLRAVQALDTPPEGDFAQANILMLTGESDPFSIKAPALEQALQAGGAQLDARLIKAGHQLSDQDIEASRLWLSSAPPS